jgi:hypothetical protein
MNFFPARAKDRSDPHDRQALCGEIRPQHALRDEMWPVCNTGAAPALQKPDPNGVKGQDWLCHSFVLIIGRDWGVAQRGGFDAVRPAALRLADCLCHFIGARIGAHPACTGSPGAGSASGAGPAVAFGSDPIAAVPDLHGLPGRLRHAADELSEHLYRCRTCYGYFEPHRGVHAQLHHPAARLQKCVQQDATTVESCPPRFPLATTRCATLRRVRDRQQLPAKSSSEPFPG